MGRFWRRRKAPTPPGHHEAVELLHRLERDKRRRDRHDDDPNFGYETPFDGGQYPGVDPRPL